MTDHAAFVVNLNEHGKHVAHRYPSFEECNADSFDKRVYLDELEVSELVDSGKARRCVRCFGTETAP